MLISDEKNAIATFAIATFASLASLIILYWLDVVDSFEFCSFCMQVIIRANNLTGDAKFIPVKAFHVRKMYYTNEVRFVKLELLISLHVFPCLHTHTY